MTEIVEELARAIEASGGVHYPKHTALCILPIITRLVSEAEARGIEKERAAIVAWLREKSEVGAERARSRDVRSPARTAFGAGSLALHRAALAIEQGKHEAQG